MEFIVTYDVNTPNQSVVKQHLLKHGFRDRIQGESGRYFKLPNTTLLFDAASREEALDIFIAVAQTAAAGVKVEKAVVVPNDGARFFSDDISQRP